MTVEGGEAPMTPATRPWAYGQGPRPEDYSMALAVLGGPVLLATAWPPTGGPQPQGWTRTAGFLQVVDAAVAHSSLCRPANRHTATTAMS
jgi:hypothetical protein